jgi:hypothetical protein
LPVDKDQSNNSTYYFFLSDPIIGWDTIPLSEASTNTSPSSTISVVTKTPDTSTETVIPSSQNTMSKTVIVGVSVGSVLVVLSIFVVCSLTYRHIKRHQTKIKRESNHPDSQGVEIQIPPDGDKHSSAYLQQYPPVYQQLAPQQLQQQFVTGMPSPPIQQH